MNNVYLLLGGNIGNVPNTFQLVCEDIEQNLGEILNKSSLYITEPWGFDTDKLFYNQALKIRTKYRPKEFLSQIVKIEAKFGRQRHDHKYNSRVIDIDILFFNNLILNSNELIVPHPRIQFRNFMLIPLFEIASKFIHPQLNKSVEELIKECEDNKWVKKCD